MKKLISLNLVWLLIAAMFFAVSCDKDDDNDNPPVLVEDGMYIKGDVTGLPALDPKGLMAAGINEVDQQPRSGMYEMYIAIEAGAAGFNIVKKAGSTETVYGPGTDFASVEISGNDQPTVTIQKGAYAATNAKFTVPTSGLYHIALDETTMTMVIVPVTKWAILGGATANGWSDTDLPLKGSFSKTIMEFEGTGIVLRAGDFKLRHSGGWKVEMADGLKCNTNFGGVLTASNMSLTLVPGGPNYAMPTDTAKHGIYTVNVKWQLDGGYTVTMTKTGSVAPLPEWPEAMYLVGAATAYGWTIGAANAEMHKCAGGTSMEGIFWKIAHLEGGQGFKLSAANWSEPNLDYADVNEWDANGVAVTADGDNWTVAESGMYMIVLNLRDDQVKVSIKPAEVYGIGDCFGGWDAQVEANKFSINLDEKTLVSPALVANGNIRMYAYHPWIAAWWNAEFRVNGTTIEYRNDGGDQDPIAGTAGQVVTLHFDDNTGSIQ